MEQQQTAPNINILSFQTHEQNSLGSFLNWSLKYGRVIVIVTEFLVIAAFISRFYFDRILSDLHDTIETKTIQVESQQAIEKKFLLIQKMLGEAGSTLEKQKDFSKLMGNINAVKPSDIQLREVSIKENELSIIAGVANTASLNQFLNGFAASDKFSDFSVEDLSIKDGQLLMSAKAVIKPAAYK